MWAENNNDAIERLFHVFYEENRMGTSQADDSRFDAGRRLNVSVRKR